MKPEYPLFISYVENGVVEETVQIDEEDWLYTEIEFFDTDSDGYVFDNLNRPVRLKVVPNKAIVELIDEVIRDNTMETDPIILEDADDRLKKNNCSENSKTGCFSLILFRLLMCFFKNQ